MKTIIIDDEQLAIDVLEVLLHRIEDIEIVGKFINPYQALEVLPTLQVDMVFLDMEMGELHGLEFAERLTLINPHIEVIFVTAHPQFALEAFEVNAIDYLLKPVDEERLAKTVEKVKKRLQMAQVYAQYEPKLVDHLVAQVLGEFHLFDRQGNRVKWRTKKVKELFILLWQHQDKGIHRSQIIMDLWPDLPEDRAVAIMHTTVYQLRKAMRELGFQKPVVFKNEQYMLDVPVKSDIDQLNAIIDQGDVNEDGAKELLTLYDGDYLEVDDYAWSLPMQENVRRSFLKCLENYVSNVQKDIQEHILLEKCLKKMVKIDPYKIKYTYYLVQYYGDTRNTKEMILLYRKAQTKWIGELGLDVPVEIVELYGRYIK